MIHSALSNWGLGCSGLGVWAYTAIPRIIQLTDVSKIVFFMFFIYLFSHIRLLFPGGHILVAGVFTPKPHFIMVDNAQVGIPGSFHTPMGYESQHPPVGAHLRQALPSGRAPDFRLCSTYRMQEAHLLCHYRPDPRDCPWHLPGRRWRNSFALRLPMEWVATESLIAAHHGRSKRKNEPRQRDRVRPPGCQECRRHPNRAD